jgi:hypothetical protein
MTPRRIVAALVALTLTLAILIAVRAAPGAPPGRYQITADTVFDTKTGLTWQRNMPMPTGGLVYAQARSYCAGLAALRTPSCEGEA